MIEVESAQERVLALIHALGSERVDLAAAVGRVLAVDLAAPLDLPPFANSSMDGYAIRSADVVAATPDSPVALAVAGEVPAGSVYTGVLAPGSALRIFTGAALPSGADAVVQQEWVTAGTLDIRLSVAIPVGMNVRSQGSDLAAGAPMLRRGTVLEAAAVAVAAASGLAKLPVARRPRVAIVTTGDELVAPGAPLLPGQIYNANAPMLAAMVHASGGDPWVLPPAADTEAEIRQRFTVAAAADLIITSGGVSVGDFDLVRAVLATLGQIDLWRVNVRPGKPFVAGRIGATPLLGLPGNPVSSAVTFELFARPAIRAMLGCAHLLRPTLQVRLSSPIARGDRRHYARVRLTFEDAQAVAHVTGDQGSHRIASLLDVDALAIIAEGAGEVAAASIVPALWLRGND